jgi:DNA-binding PadR family transcriptional regulator
LIQAKWGTSDNNRAARYYRLTAAGKERLRAETNNWREVVAAMTTVLAATPREV